MGGGTGRTRGRGLMQPATLASPGVAAAVPELPFGGHVWVRSGPDGRGVRRSLGFSGRLAEGQAGTPPLWRRLQIVSSQSSTPRTFSSPAAEAHLPFPFPGAPASPTREASPRLTRAQPGVDPNGLVDPFVSPPEREALAVGEEQAWRILPGARNKGFLAALATYFICGLRSELYTLQRGTSPL